MKVPIKVLTLINRAKSYLKRYLPEAILVGFSLLIFIVSVRVTLFRYRNFEYGKFDLGNMSQMVYNSAHGRFMEVTDYFGTNMPRWGMSHVDPFLLVFVPVYLVFPDAKVLIVGQVSLIVSSAAILYFIGLKILKRKLPALLIAMSFLLYPAVGYLLAWTGFHGVTSVVPFFLLAFLTFEIMDENNSFSPKRLVLFYALVVLTMFGKEEISLIILMYGIYIAVFRKRLKIGVSLATMGLVWFIVSFLLLIPSSAKYRIQGFEKFAKDVELTVNPQRDVLKPNYFISRYSEFGDSYLEVAKNLVLQPKRVARVFFSGDKKENFSMTFTPLLYTPLFFLPVLMIALPEFAINYMTTAGGIGVSEIYNHRISMIIPILFISVFYAIKLFEVLFAIFLKKKPRFLALIISSMVLLSCIYTSNKYQNPIMLWFTQSLQKRIAMINVAFANEESSETKKALVPGDRAKINRLETKDRNCFDEVVDLIPRFENGNEVSVSAPDYLGDHLSTRRVNALFPANFNTADYVVVDVFSKKVATILGVDQSLVNRVVGKVVRDPNYKLVFSCSNIFIFEKVGEHGKKDILPLQEDFNHVENVNFTIGQSIVLVDFKLPTEIIRTNEFHINYVYKKTGSDGLDSFVLYTSFVNKETQTIHQVANLPSFGIKPMSGWGKSVYYIEDNNFVLPGNIKDGTYSVYVGMTNNIKTYNIYLGDIQVK